MSSLSQSGILAPVPREARFYELDLAPGADPRAVLHGLAAWDADPDLLVGFGASFVASLDAQVPGLRVHPCHVGPGLQVPSTPAALWIRVIGPDRGAIHHRSRLLLENLGPRVELVRVVDAFTFAEGKDLSGYEDGTENPKGEEASRAALVQGLGPGLDGSSFLAAQVWVHDLPVVDRMDLVTRDHCIGRSQVDNQELADAPVSAHVKRAAQESFTPAAFVLRRSMPWTDGRRAGLVFLAFSHSFDAYEAILARMVGQEDGVTDALFSFTHPESGAFYWCPPVRDGALDLRALGL